MDILKQNSALREQLAAAGMIQVSFCTPEETKEYNQMIENGEELPNNVFANEGYVKSYSKIFPSDLTDAELLNMIEATKLGKVASIQKWVIFFGVLIIIGLIGGLITLIAMLAS